jgi:hypothetical protein
MTIESAQTMRVLRTIPTPWTPYSVMFARDGTRLAIGGGVFYGNGGILMVDLSSDRSELFRCAELPHAKDDWVPAISGVCFSDDDRYLLASSWQARHSYAPTLVFEVSGLHLSHKDTLTMVSPAHRTCPTGVLLSAEYTITRNHGVPPDRALVVHKSPQVLGIHAHNTTQCLTNSHLVVVRNHVITAGRGLALGVTTTHNDYWRPLLEFREADRAVAEGLVSIILQAEAQTPQLIPVQACPEITAIAATPDGEGFLTGGLEGELDRWSWDAGWRQERLRDWTFDSPRVRGICYLCGGHEWVAVSSSGTVDLMAGNARLASWQSPTPGSPRSLAAHPARNGIAIGMKQGGAGDPRGAVDVIEA